MATYTFRAEADVDRVRFFAALAAAGFSVSTWSAGAGRSSTDVVCEFDTDADLDQMLEVARTVADTHILRRTLQPGTAASADVFGEYANPDE